MFITSQEPGSAGLAGTADTDGLLRRLLITAGINPPQPRSGWVLLRDLIDDRLLEALLERSRDEAGGLRLTGEVRHAG